MSTESMGTQPERPTTAYRGPRAGLVRFLDALGFVFYIVAGGALALGVLAVVNSGESQSTVVLGTVVETGGTTEWSGLVVGLAAAFGYAVLGAVLQALSAIVDDLSQLRAAG